MRRRALSLLPLLLAGCTRLGFYGPAEAGGKAGDGPSRWDRPGDRAADRSPLDTSSLDVKSPADAKRPPDNHPPDHPSLVLFVVIPAMAGSMGSPSTEPCRTENEDLHAVTLTRSFALQSTEVTSAQFQQRMGYPAGNTCASCPVVSVTWSQAATYCNALSSAAGLSLCYTCTGSGATISCSESAASTQIYACPGYRLPTEAEWELAYRAGSTTALYSGAITAAACTDCAGSNPVIDSIAWYCANAKAPQPVGGKAANKLGLHDMAGNVWEWCHDRYQTSLGTGAVTDPAGPPTGADRVIRGGGFMNWVEVLRGAFRGFVKPTMGLVDLGFRCARSLP